MDGKVRYFNNLPRPRETPTGLPNHWVFGVCHVDLDPPGDVVMAVHAKSEYLKSCGSPQLSSASSTDKAKAIVSCLLSAFSSSRPPDPELAPWTWSTLDQEMAQAIQDSLRDSGVRSELCQVGVCSAAERETLESVRARCFDKVMDTLPSVSQGDSTKCHSCGKSRESFFKPLQMCVRCNNAWYHSMDCQNKHWNHHRPTCHLKTNVPDLDGFAYYRSIAGTNADARALMNSLKLEPHPGHGRLIFPIRRLIITGKDTPGNLELLFGPHWEHEKTLKQTYQDARIAYLLDPPPSSRSHFLNLDLDKNAPARSPRPATEDEQKRIQTVRKIQELIIAMVGPGKEPTTQDIVAIMAQADFEGSMPEYISAQTLAINALDRRVPTTGRRPN